MTRPAIPLIGYFETFHQDESMWPLADQGILAMFQPVAKELIVQVGVAGEVYEEVRNAAWKNLKRLELGSATQDDVAGVARQLAAYQYDWHPSLGGLSFPHDRKPLARFLLGGLIFGAYAQAADADHVLQDKRSQLFLTLTRPGVGSPATRYEREEDLFVKLKETITRADSAVHFSDLPAMPSILPDILSRTPAITKVSEILPRAIEIRQSMAGEAYRLWFKQLRTALGDGRYATNEKRKIEAVRKEAEHRLKDEYSKWGCLSLQPCPQEHPLPYQQRPRGRPWKERHLGDLKLEGEKIRLALPDWIRNMVVDHLPFRRHRKLLLRSALAQAEFQNVSVKLKKIWFDS
jgi:hypothetical protein